MSAENTTNTGAQEAENAEKYAVEVKNVTKIYRLYDKPIDRLKESLSVSHKEYHKDFYALSDLPLRLKKVRRSASSVRMVRVNRRSLRSLPAFSRRRPAR